uniref:NB-ARC domain-containing protein n=1 Tax=Oryza meridionalis TaxID=40149 RepID=A0A0E0ENJ7_9ORYZ
MAESLILPMVRGVAAKAADALVQSVTGACGAVVDDDRRKLQRQLLAVQSALADAEARSETNLAVKRWMKDLSAAAYDADDVLDDFRYEALRRDAEVGDGKVLGYFTPHNPLLFRVTMSKKLSNVLEKMNKLVEQMNELGLSVDRTESPQELKPPYIQIHSAALDESSDIDIVGRDDDKEVMVKLLLDQRDEKRLQVLPVVGMGGSGKTTLAKMVYNDTRVRDHFQLKMWHCVSENFEAVPLLKSIVELATNTRCQLLNTIEQLRRELRSVIDQRRFLLVLDNVWNEDDKKWEDDLKPILSSVGGHGSVIVVTTRSQRVASIMGTMGSHELACLNDDDSWELLSKKAFSREVNEEAALVTIGKLIIKKCRGLPLALKTMGGLMSSKQLVSEWETIAESSIGVRVQSKSDVLDILNLSYRHLPSEMKQCFAFCAVFPKGCDMEKDKLIQLWIANGFVQEDGNVDLIHKGEFIFHDLVWRSFLQDVETKKRHYYCDDSVVFCKMNDLMHDLARDVTYQCASTTKELSHEKESAIDVRNMVVQWYKSQEMMMEPFKGTTSLRSLIVQLGSYNHFEEFRYLSIRAFNCSIMYQQLINERHLRYLDLSETCIVRLPDSVSMSYNLQTLRLNNCRNLKYLPESMSAMRKLMHLYLFGCGNLEKMPPNINLLNNLRTLTTFIVDIEAGREIKEIKRLRHLANRLELYNLRKIYSRENGEEANLHEKDLSELVLYWGRNEKYMPENSVCDEEEVLDSLRPHAKLKVLELHGYSGLNIPQWMRDPQMFQSLRILHISNSPGCKDLPSVQLSVSLERLVLSSMDNLTTLCKNVGVEVEGHSIPLQIFPKLKYMKLCGLPNLEKWAENAAGEAHMLTTFPEIEILKIHDCPKLASVPNCPVLKKLKTYGHCSLEMISLAHLTALSKLYHVANDVCVSMQLCSWPSLVELSIRSSPDMVTALEVETNQCPLENLRRLSLYHVRCFIAASGLSDKYLGLWKCFAFVEDLQIAWHNYLVCWPVEELTSLIHLRSLTTDYCGNLEGRGSSFMSLTYLEKLRVRYCNNLQEIPKLPASLEVLLIEHCSRLAELPNLGDLSRLKILHVQRSLHLKELPDGMDGLTSLEELKIWDCALIEKFPQGLLQRIPTLRHLALRRCPGLLRRCIQGGEYFDLLSSIPYKVILAAGIRSSTNSFVNRSIKRYLWFLKMDRIRRIAGAGKAKFPSAVQKDKDESLVFFRELYKRDKERDINLLEPMYSVEFDAIQGGHTGKAPSGKRDFLIPVDEKHDYDWLKTPPATPLFPSIEMEANSSQMVFHKELPIPRPVKPSASRLSGKTEATKTSARSMFPAPNSSSKKNIFRVSALSISNEKNRIDRRSTSAAITSRKQKAVAAVAPTAPAATCNATNKHSDRCYASQGSSTNGLKRVTNPELPYCAPKNLITTPSTAKAWRRDLAFGVHDTVEIGRIRRQSCLPVATSGTKVKIMDGKQKGLPDKVKAVTVSNNHGRAGDATLIKGMRTDGKKEQRPKHGNQAK